MSNLRIPLRVASVVAVSIGLVAASIPLAHASLSADAAPGVTVTSDSSGLTVRKDVKDLTAAEKSAFIAAILKAKSTPDPADPSHSYYDRFVLWHKQAFACSLGWQQKANWAGAAHNSPTFLPWHRQLLSEFEAMLREVSGDPTMSLPYWDWTDPASTAAVLAPDFMGGSGNKSQGYALTTGPFAKGKWTLTVLDPPSVQKASAEEKPYIVRRFGAFPNGGVKLPTADEVHQAVSTPVFDSNPYDGKSPLESSFRNMLEGWRKAKPAVCTKGWIDQSQMSGSPHVMHNGVHIWVAGVWQDPGGVSRQGTMGFNTSPNDPIFFLHHANIDRIFAAWEQRNPTATYRPAANAKLGWNATDTMWPWKDRTIDSWFGTARNGYVYASLPQ